MRKNSRGMKPVMLRSISVKNIPIQYSFSFGFVLSFRDRLFCWSRSVYIFSLELDNGRSIIYI